MYKCECIKCLTPMWHGASVRSIKTARSDDDDDGSAARCTPLVLENLGSGDLCQSKEGGRGHSPQGLGIV